jgi:AraC family L-rhamnose operon regulatory protein RhaS
LAESVFLEFAFQAILRKIRTMPEKTSQPLAVSFPRIGLKILESHHQDDFRMAWTRHPFLKMLYVLKGSGHLEEGKRRRPLQNPCVAVIPPGVRHRLVDTPQDPLSVWVLCYRSSVLRPYQRFPLRSSVVTCHPLLGRLLEPRLRQVLYEQTILSSGHEAILTGQALELWGLWERWQTQRSSRQPLLSLPPASWGRVQAYREQLERTFYQPQKLSEAAQQTGLSIRRFTQLFRAVAGCSWLDEVRRYRLRHACRLLLSTNRSVLSICFECGFDDLSTFYRSFQAQEGLSPQRWRTQRLGK